MVPRLKILYKEKIIPKLMDIFEYKSIMQVPKISKIVLNMGVGEGARDKKTIQFAIEDMRKISGQQPIITIARKSIAGFKIRDGMAIGCKVTLRQTRMYEFLDRLISIAIPRVRDFQGLSPKKFDGFGNYNMGVKEQIIFPEISYDAVDKIRGLDICIVTTAKTNDEAKILLRLFDFPLIGVGVS